MFEELLELFKKYQEALKQYKADDNAINEKKLSNAQFSLDNFLDFIPETEFLRTDFGSITYKTCEKNSEKSEVPSLAVKDPETATELALYYITFAKEKYGTEKIKIFQSPLEKAPFYSSIPGDLFISNKDREKYGVSTKPKAEQTFGELLETLLFERNTTAEAYGKSGSVREFTIRGWINNKYNKVDATVFWRFLAEGNFSEEERKLLLLKAKEKNGLSTKLKADQSFSELLANLIFEHSFQINLLEGSGINPDKISNSWLKTNINSVISADDLKEFLNVANFPKNDKKLLEEKRAQEQQANKEAIYIKSPKPKAEQNFNELLLTLMHDYNFKKNWLSPDFKYDNIKDGAISKADLDRVIAKFKDKGTPLSEDDIALIHKARKIAKGLSILPVEQQNVNQYFANVIDDYGFEVRDFEVEGNGGVKKSTVSTWTDGTRPKPELFEKLLNGKAAQKIPEQIKATLREKLYSEKLSFEIETLFFNKKNVNYSVREISDENGTYFKVFFISTEGNGREAEGKVYYYDGKSNSSKENVLLAIDKKAAELGVNPTAQEGKKSRFTKEYNNILKPGTDNTPPNKTARMAVKDEVLEQYPNRNKPHEVLYSKLEALKALIDARNNPDRDAKNDKELDKQIEKAKKGISSYIKKLNGKNPPENFEFEYRGISEDKPFETLLAETGIDAETIEKFNEAKAKGPQPEKTTTPSLNEQLEKTYDLFKTWQDLKAKQEAGQDGVSKDQVEKAKSEFREYIESLYKNNSAADKATLLKLISRFSIPVFTRDGVDSRLTEITYHDSFIKESNFALMDAGLITQVVAYAGINKDRNLSTYLQIDQIAAAAKESDAKLSYEIIPDNGIDQEKLVVKTRDGNGNVIGEHTFYDTPDNLRITINYIDKLNGKLPDPNNPKPRNPEVPFAELLEEYGNKEDSYLKKYEILLEKTEKLAAEFNSKYGNRNPDGTITLNFDPSSDPQKFQEFIVDLHRLTDCRTRLNLVYEIMGCYKESTEIAGISIEALDTYKNRINAVDSSLNESSKLVEPVTKIGNEGIETLLNQCSHGFKNRYSPFLRKAQGQIILLAQQQDKIQAINSDIQQQVNNYSTNQILTDLGKSYEELSQSEKIAYDILITKQSVNLDALLSDNSHQHSEAVRDLSSKLMMIIYKREGEEKVFDAINESLIKNSELAKANGMDLLTYYATFSHNSLENLDIILKAQEAAKLSERASYSDVNLKLMGLDVSYPNSRVGAYSHATTPIPQETFQNLDALFSDFNRQYLPENLKPSFYNYQINSFTAAKNGVLPGTILLTPTGELSVMSSTIFKSPQAAILNSPRLTGHEIGGHYLDYEYRIANGWGTSLDKLLMNSFTDEMAAAFEEAKFLTELTKQGKIDTKTCNQLLALYANTSVRSYTVHTLYQKALLERFQEKGKLERSDFTELSNEYYKNYFVGNNNPPENFEYIGAARFIMNENLAFHGLNYTFNPFGYFLFSKWEKLNTDEEKAEFMKNYYEFMNSPLPISERVQSFYGISVNDAIIEGINVVTGFNNKIIEYAHQDFEKLKELYNKIKTLEERGTFYELPKARQELLDFLKTAPIQYLEAEIKRLPDGNEAETKLKDGLGKEFAKAKEITQLADSKNPDPEVRAKEVAQANYERSIYLNTGLNSTEIKGKLVEQAKLSTADAEKAFTFLNFYRGYTMGIEETIDNTQIEFARNALEKTKSLAQELKTLNSGDSDRVFGLATKYRTELSGTSDNQYSGFRGRNKTDFAIYKDINPDLYSLLEKKINSLGEPTSNYSGSKSYSISIEGTDKQLTIVIPSGTGKDFIQIIYPDRNIIQQKLNEAQDIFKELLSGKKLGTDGNLTDTNLTEEEVKRNIAKILYLSKIVPFAGGSSLTLDMLSKAFMMNYGIEFSEYNFGNDLSFDLAAMTSRSFEDFYENYFKKSCYREALGAKREIIKNSSDKNQKAKDTPICQTNEWKKKRGSLNDDKQLEVDEKLKNAVTEGNLEEFKRLVQYEYADPDKILELAKRSNKHVILCTALSLGANSSLLKHPTYEEVLLELAGFDTHNSNTYQAIKTIIGLEVDGKKVVDLNYKDPQRKHTALDKVCFRWDRDTNCMGIAIDLVTAGAEISDTVIESLPSHLCLTLINSHTAKTALLKEYYEKLIKKSIIEGSFESFTTLAKEKEANLGNIKIGNKALIQYALENCSSNRTNLEGKSRIIDYLINAKANLNYTREGEPYGAIFSDLYSAFKDYNKLLDLYINESIDANTRKNGLDFIIAYYGGDYQSILKKGNLSPFVFEYTVEGAKSTIAYLNVMSKLALLQTNLPDADIGSLIRNSDCIENGNVNWIKFDETIKHITIDKINQIPEIKNNPDIDKVNVDNAELENWKAQEFSKDKDGKTISKFDKFTELEARLNKTMHFVEDRAVKAGYVKLPYPTDANQEPEFYTKAEAEEYHRISSERKANFARKLAYQMVSGNYDPTFVDGFIANTDYLETSINQDDVIYKYQKEDGTVIESLGAVIYSERKVIIGNLADMWIVLHEAGHQMHKTDEVLSKPFASALEENSDFKTEVRNLLEDNYVHNDYTDELYKWCQKDAYKNDKTRQTNEIVAELYRQYNEVLAEYNGNKEDAKTEMSLRYPSLFYAFAPLIENYRSDLDQLNEMRSKVDVFLSNQANDNIKANEVREGYTICADENGIRYLAQRRTVTVKYNTEEYRLFSNFYRNDRANNEFYNFYLPSQRPIGEPVEDKSKTNPEADNRDYILFKSLEQHFTIHSVATVLDKDRNPENPENKYKVYGWVPQDAYNKEKTRWVFDVDDFKNGLKLQAGQGLLGNVTEAQIDVLTLEQINQHINNLGYETKLEIFPAGGGRIVLKDAVGNNIYAQLNGYIPDPAISDWLRIQVSNGNPQFAHLLKPDEKPKVISIGGSAGLAMQAGEGDQLAYIYFNKETKKFEHFSEAQTGTENEAKYQLMAKINRTEILKLNGTSIKYNSDASGFKLELVGDRKAYQKFLGGAKSQLAASILNGISSTEDAQNKVALINEMLSTQFSIAVNEVVIETLATPAKYQPNPVVAMAVANDATVQLHKILTKEGKLTSADIAEIKRLIYNEQINFKADFVEDGINRSILHELFYRGGKGELDKAFFEDLFRYKGDDIVIPKNESGNRSLLFALYESLYADLESGKTYIATSDQTETLKFLTQKLFEGLSAREQRFFVGYKSNVTIPPQIVNDIENSVDGKTLAKKLDGYSEIIAEQITDEFDLESPNVEKLKAKSRALFGSGNNFAEEINTVIDHTLDRHASTPQKHAGSANAILSNLPEGNKQVIFDILAEHYDPLSPEASYKNFSTNLKFLFENNIITANEFQNCGHDGFKHVILQNDPDYYIELTNKKAIEPTFNYLGVYVEAEIEKFNISLGFSDFAEDSDIKIQPSYDGFGESAEEKKLHKINFQKINEVARALLSAGADANLIPTITAAGYVDPNLVSSAPEIIESLYAAYIIEYHRTGGKVASADKTAIESTIDMLVDALNPQQRLLVLNSILAKALGHESIAETEVQEFVKTHFLSKAVYISSDVVEAASHAVDERGNKISTATEMILNSGKPFNRVATVNSDSDSKEILNSVILTTYIVQYINTKDKTSEEAKRCLDNIVESVKDGASLNIVYPLPNKKGEYKTAYQVMTQTDSEGNPVHPKLNDLVKYLKKEPFIPQIWESTRPIQIIEPDFSDYNDIQNVLNKLGEENAGSLTVRDEKPVYTAPTQSGPQTLPSQNGVPSTNQPQASVPGGVLNPFMPQGGIIGPTVNPRYSGMINPGGNNSDNSFNGFSRHNVKAGFRMPVNDANNLRPGNRGPVTKVPEVTTDKDNNPLPGPASRMGVFFVTDKDHVEPSNEMRLRLIGRGSENKPSKFYRFNNQEDRKYEAVVDQRSNNNPSTTPKSQNAWEASAYTYAWNKTSKSKNPEEDFTRIISNIQQVASIRSPGSFPGFIGLEAAAEIFRASKENNFGAEYAKMHSEKGWHSLGTAGMLFAADNHWAGAMARKGWFGAVKPFMATANLVHRKITLDMVGGWWGQHQILNYNDAPWYQHAISAGAYGSFIGLPQYFAQALAGFGKGKTPLPPYVGATSKVLKWADPGVALFEGYMESIGYTSAWNIDPTIAGGLWKYFGLGNYTYDSNARMNPQTGIIETISAEQSYANHLAFASASGNPALAPISYYLSGIPNPGLVESMNANLQEIKTDGEQVEAGIKTKGFNTKEMLLISSGGPSTKTTIVDLTPNKPVPITTELTEGRIPQIKIWEEIFGPVGRFVPLNDTRKNVENIEQNTKVVMKGEYLLPIDARGAIAPAILQKVGLENLRQFSKISIVDITPGMDDDKPRGTAIVTFAIDKSCNGEYVLADEKSPAAIIFRVEVDNNPNTMRLENGKPVSEAEIILAELSANFASLTGRNFYYGPSGIIKKGNTYQQEVKFADVNNPAPQDYSKSPFYNNDQHSIYITQEQLNKINSKGDDPIYKWNAISVNRTEWTAATQTELDNDEPKFTNMKADLIESATNNRLGYLGIKTSEPADIMVVLDKYNNPYYPGNSFNLVKINEGETITVSSVKINKVSEGVAVKITKTGQKDEIFYFYDTNASTMAENILRANPAVNVKLGYASSANYDKERARAERELAARKEKQIVEKQNSFIANYSKTIGDIRAILYSTTLNTGDEKKEEPTTPVIKLPEAIVAAHNFQMNIGKAISKKEPITDKEIDEFNKEAARIKELAAKEMDAINKHIEAIKTTIEAEKKSKSPYKKENLELLNNLLTSLSSAETDYGYKDLQKVLDYQTEQVKVAQEIHKFREGIADLLKKEPKADITRLNKLNQDQDIMALTLNNPDLSKDLETIKQKVKNHPNFTNDKILQELYKELNKDPKDKNPPDAGVVRFLATMYVNRVANDYSAEFENIKKLTKQLEEESKKDVVDTKKIAKIKEEIEKETGKFEKAKEALKETMNGLFPAFINSQEIAKRSSHPSNVYDINKLQGQLTGKYELAKNKIMDTEYHLSQSFFELEYAALQEKRRILIIKDDKGKIKNEVYLDRAGNVSKLVEHKYDKKGKEIEVIEHLYSQDKDGKLIEIVTKTKDGKKAGEAETKILDRLPIIKIAAKVDGVSEHFAPIQSFALPDDKGIIAPSVFKIKIEIDYEGKTLFGQNIKSHRLDKDSQYLTKLDVKLKDMGDTPPTEVEGKVLITRKLYEDALRRKYQKENLEFNLSEEAVDENYIVYRTRLARFEQEVSQDHTNIDTDKKYLEILKEIYGDDFPSKNDKSYKLILDLENAIKNYTPAPAKVQNSSGKQSIHESPFWSLGDENFIQINRPVVFSPDTEVTVVEEEIDLSTDMEPPVTEGRTPISPTYTGVDKNGGESLTKRNDADVIIKKPNPFETLPIDRKDEKTSLPNIPQDKMPKFEPRTFGDAWNTEVTEIAKTPQPELKFERKIEVKEFPAEVKPVEIKESVKTFAEEGVAVEADKPKLPSPTNTTSTATAPKTETPPIDKKLVEEQAKPTTAKTSTDNSGKPAVPATPSDKKNEPSTEVTKKPSPETEGATKTTNSDNPTQSGTATPANTPKPVEVTETKPVTEQPSKPKPANPVDTEIKLQKVVSENVETVNFGDIVKKVEFPKPEPKPGSEESELPKGDEGVTTPEEATKATPATPATKPVTAPALPAEEEGQIATALLEALIPDKTSLTVTTETGILDAKTLRILGASLDPVDPGTGKTASQAQLDKLFSPEITMPASLTRLDGFEALQEKITADNSEQYKGTGIDANEAYQEFRQLVELAKETRDPATINLLKESSEAFILKAQAEATTELQDKAIDDIKRGSNAYIEEAPADLRSTSDVEKEMEAIREQMTTLREEAKKEITAAAERKAKAEARKAEAKEEGKNKKSKKRGE